MTTRKVEVEGGIVVEVEDHGEEEEEEKEEEDMNPRSSEEPSSFSSCLSKSLSSLSQPISGHHPFAFRHPARGGSMSSTGSPPFTLSCATVTPQSKSTSTRELHSTGNVEITTASSLPSGGSPTSAVSPSSSVPSPQDACSMPMPPHHPAAAGGCQRPPTAPSPVSPTPASLMATRPRQMFEGRRQLRQSIGSEVLHESDREEDRPSHSGQPSPDSSLEARERKNSVGLLFPTIFSAESQVVLTWLTELQCNFSRANQRHFPLPPLFTEYKHGLWLWQQWKFTTQFSCLSI